MNLGEIISSVNEEIGSGGLPDVQYPNGAQWFKGDRQLSLYCTESGDVMVDQFVVEHGHQNTVAAGPKLVIEYIKWVLTEETDG